jgi:hypothetical protein
MFTRERGGLRLSSPLPANHLDRIAAARAALLAALGEHADDLARVVDSVEADLKDGFLSRQRLIQLGKLGNTRAAVEYPARNYLWAIFAPGEAPAQSCPWAIPPRAVDNRNRPLRNGLVRLELWMEDVEFHWRRWSADRDRAKAKGQRPPGAFPAGPTVTLPKPPDRSKDIFGKG